MPLRIVSYRLISLRIVLHGFALPRFASHHIKIPLPLTHSISNSHHHYPLIRLKHVLHLIAFFVTKCIFHVEFLFCHLDHPHPRYFGLRTRIHISCYTHFAIAIIIILMEGWDRETEEAETQKSFLNWQNRIKLIFQWHFGNVCWKWCASVRT